MKSTFAKSIFISLAIAIISIASSNKMYANEANDLTGKAVTLTLIYPVPVTNVLYAVIEATELSNVSVQLVDIMGRTSIVKDAQLTIGENKISIATDELKTGVYFIQIINKSTGEKTFQQFNKM